MTIPKFLHIQICSSACFISSGFFSLLFIMLRNFCWRTARHNIQDKRNWSTKSFSVRFCVWWGARLCLMFAIVEVVRSFNFPSILVFFLLFLLDFSINSSESESVSSSFLSYSWLLSWSSIVVVVEYWRREVLYNLVITSLLLLFSYVRVPGLWLSEKFLSLLFSLLTWGSKARMG